MKAEVLRLLPKIPPKEKVNGSVSLVPFVRFLEKMAEDQNNVRLTFFEYALNIIKGIDGWDKEIFEKDLPKFEQAFELIYFTFTSPIDNENQQAWALAEPFTGNVFFGTNAFYDLVSDGKGQLRKEFIESREVGNISLDREKLLYSFILRKAYNITTTFSGNIIHSHVQPETGLRRYSRLEFDSQYVTVTHDDPLPELDFTAFRANRFDQEKNLETIAEQIPLSGFDLRGFSIVKITDVTADYVLEKIKNNIVNLAAGRQIHEDIAYYLKTLFADNKIDIRIYPIQKVNNEFAMGSLDNIERTMMFRCDTYQLEPSVYKEALIKYLANPELLFYPDLSIVQKDEPDLVALYRQMCMKSLTVIPITFHKNLVGFMELASDEKDRLSPHKLSVLTPVMPLLEQLLQTIIDDFNLTIDGIIKDKFTSLQPSVQWRFNRAAWNYLERREVDVKAEIEHVFFTDVYPLYGAVDIRNSTVQRNQALQEDMEARLKSLSELLVEIKAQLSLGLIDELIFKTSQWRQKISKFIDSDDEYHLLLFLSKDIDPLLMYFLQDQMGPVKAIQQYFKDGQSDGAFFNNRNELERSMQAINLTIRTVLDEMNKKAQEMFPCYFEKFRTDGMEYNIYIGQSISPHKKFDVLYLRNLRLLQLNSMAEIIKKTQELLPQLEKKLETTQLIFVHTNTIDISFRNDERRFDVEGMYNIRYEMVKKRIDKVHIKDSQERLTQPGTISIVYFQKDDIMDYLNYATYMREQGVLDDNFEFLKLEELQGLSGLKALRLKVIV